MNGTEVPVSVGVDFAPVFSRVCEESDYEPWAPDNGRVTINGKRCLMGREVFYKRKKPAADCFNSDKFERVLNVSYCECTDDDWEW